MAYRLIDDPGEPVVTLKWDSHQAEIEGLLDLLDRHDCLGLLKEKRREDQVKAFAERADRQLLVALHELTQGKPFEEIILAEHQRVYPEQARQLYLDIATMRCINLQSKFERVPYRAFPALNSMITKSVSSSH